MTELTPFEQKCREARDMMLYVRKQEEWVRTQSSLNSMLLFKHGGASVDPHFKSEDEIHAMADYMLGARAEIFDPAQQYTFREIAREIGLKIGGSRLRLHCIDEQSSAWSNERFFTWWTPKGDLLAMVDYRYNMKLLAVEHDDMEPRAFLVKALEAMETAWKGELKKRDEDLRKRNERRAERGLPLYPDWRHLQNPDLMSFPQAG